ncbi:uncharacterized protein [Dysidea avara]|uniref:uncharacterized protein n=1 Tax=Dysidea avara TaxID=196820 RepID=UPI00331CE1EF
MSHNQQGSSPLPTSSPSVIKRNRRGMVLVDGAFSKLRQSGGGGTKSGTASPPDSPTSSQATGEGSSLSPPPASSTTSYHKEARPKSGPAFTHHSLHPSLSSNSDPHSTASSRPKSTSPIPGLHSNRSSISSQSESISSMSTVNLQLQSSTLHDIRQQMLTSLTRMRKLEEKVKKIPELKSAIKQLRNVNSDLQGQLKLEVKREEELKQEVEKLQADNMQLATNSSSITTESDLNVIRSTLVASINRFKQVEEDNKQIPLLKSKITELEKQLANTSQPSPRLVPSVARLPGEFKRVEGELKRVDHMISGLRYKVEEFEKEDGTMTTMKQHISELGKEKQSLVQEVAKLKTTPEVTQDSNYSQVMKENVSLRNMVLRLKDKLMQVESDMCQQKEQFTLKLFDMEAITVQASVCEVERQVKTVRGEGKGSSDGHPGMNEITEMKKQQLRLQQLEIQNKQSQSLIQTLLTQRLELERKMTQLFREKKSDTATDSGNRNSVSMMESIVTELEGTHSEALLTSGVITRPTLEQEKIQARIKELEDGLAKAKVALKANEDSKKLQRELHSSQKDHNKLKKKLETIEEQLTVKDSEISQLKETASKYESLSNEYCQLVENYDKAKEQIASSNAELQQYKEDFENASAEVTALGEQVQETEVKLSDLQASYDDLCSEKNQLEEELAMLKVDHESEIAVAQERIAASDAEKESLASQTNKLREKIVSLSDEISTLLCEKRAVERKLETLSAESPALLQENIELKFRKEKLEDEVKESSKKMDRLQQEFETAKQDLANKKAEETEYHNQMSQWKISAASWQEEKTTMNKERQSLRGELEERTKSLTQTKTELNTSKAECNKLHNELEVSKQQLIELQGQMSTKQVQLEGLSVEKEKLQSDTQSEVGLLSEKVKALTEQLTTEEALRTQAQSQHDKVAKKVTELEEGYAAKCQELEKAKTSGETMQEELNQKLSQAQRETAEAKQLSQLLQQQIQDFKQDHTSLQSDKEVSVATIHQLKQDLHVKTCKVTELEATLTNTTGNMQTRLDNFEQDKKSLQEKCDKLDEQLREAKQEHSTIIVSLKETEKLHLSEKEHAKSLTDELQRITKQLEDLQKEHTKATDDLSRYSTDQSTIQQQLTASQQVVKEKETLVTSLQDKLNQSSTKCAELQLQVTGLEEKYSSLELEKSKGSSELEELRSQLTKKDKELIASKKKLEAELFQMQQQLSETDSVKKEALLKSEDFEKRLALTTESFTSELTTLKQERDTSTSKVIDIESNLSLTKLKNDKLTQELDSLKSQSKSLTDKLKSAEDKAVEFSKEITDLKAKLQVSKDEFLATQTSRDRLVDRYDNLEMEYEQLKHRVQQELGQSSQLKADNKELFRLLESAQGEMPSIQSEATRTIQEENEKLEKEISVLSQWNDKQRQELETLENKLSRVTDQKQKLLAELLKKENFEQENKQLKKELHEVEQEVLVLKSKTDSEELSMKLQAQLQLVAVFNDHNKSLQDQVQQLQKQVISLGGQLEHSGPVEPSVDVILQDMGGGGAPTSKGNRRKRLGSESKSNRSSKSVTPATTNGQSDIAAEISVLLSENEMLKKKLTSLEAHVGSGKEKVPLVLRQPSVLFALSSVHNMENGTPEDSVPTEVLLPCSLLADALSSGNKDISSPNMQQHFSAVKTSWFNCVAQKNVTATQVESYMTTFHRLSPDLLTLIVNCADGEGNTALHHAVSSANHGVMNILLSCEGLETNSKNQAGYSPTMLAMVTKIESDSHKAALRRLLRKSDVNFQGKDNQTALMLVSCTGDHVMLQLLLETDVDPNIQDADGSTALMCACEHGNLEITRSLVAHPNCDVTIKDNDDMMALQIAKEAGHPDIVTLLQSHNNT